MKTVWVTRTEPGASRLADVLQRHGMRAICQPALAIVAIQQWRNLPATPVPQLVIVVSAHAARRYVQSHLAAVAAQCVHVAIGERSADILREGGLPQVQTPSQAGTSEAVLQMPTLQALVAPASVWLISGAGGRDVLRSQLCRRGIDVVKFEFYRRQVVQIDALPVRQIDIIEVSSADALTVVAQTWRRLRGNWQLPVVVPSVRLQELARQAGFQQVRLAGDASPDAIAATCAT